MVVKSFFFLICSGITSALHLHSCIITEAHLLHDEEVDGDGKDLGGDVTDSQLHDKVFILQRQTLGDCGTSISLLSLKVMFLIRLTLHSSQGEEQIGDLKAQDEIHDISSIPSDSGAFVQKPVTHSRVGQRRRHDVRRMSRGRSDGDQATR